MRTMKNLMALCLIIVWCFLAYLLPISGPARAEVSKKSGVTSGGPPMAGPAPHEDHSQSPAPNGNSTLPEVKSPLDHEESTDHDHQGSEGVEHHKDCLICTEYWNEPWRIGDLVTSWMKIKSVKILIFIFLLYIYCKRTQIAALVKRTGSGEKKA
jgi:hypothetical protein